MNEQRGGNAAAATKAGAAKGSGKAGGEARVRFHSFCCDEWSIEPNTTHFHLAACARLARQAALRRAKNKGSRWGVNAGPKKALSKLRPFFHAPGADDVVLLPDVLLALDRRSSLAKRAASEPVLRNQRAYAFNIFTLFHLSSDCLRDARHGSAARLVRVLVVCLLF